MFVLFITLFFVTPELLFCGNINFFENKDYNNFPNGYGFSKESKFRKVIDLNGKWEYRKKNDSKWEEVFIPSCYEYKGELVFRKEFKIDSSFVDKHLKLFSYGVNYSCTIIMNDRLIGNHFGGHSSFSFEIPDNIVNLGEKNVIEVRVDSRLDIEKTIPITEIMSKPRKALVKIFMYNIPLL